MRWRFWRKRNKVLLVGYSPTLIGGVITVMNLLCKEISYLELHVALRYYRPKWKAIVFSIYSVVMFALRLIVSPPCVVQVIVASRGDALRTLPYILLGKMRGCNICLHFHKSIPIILDTYLAPIRRLVLSTWRLADRHCFLSNGLRDEFDMESRSAAVPVVIPNPISHRWLCQDIAPFRERTRDLVFFGRWSWEKGNEDLLSVMRVLADRCVRLDVYSDNCPKEAPANCTFHGWVAEDEVRKVLCEAKLVLLPSRSEAYPTILLEAAACGTPFVATNIAGIPDIASESHAGLLHEVGDVEGMRVAITQLLTDETMWTECSRSGRQWVESLEVSNIVPRWHRLYSDLGLKLA
jgi:glycosyltransferase involved in cell wall biosynthesis